MSPQTHMPRVSGAFFICWVPPAHLAVVGAETLPSVSSGAKELISGSSDKCSEDTKTHDGRVAGRTALERVVTAGFSEELSLEAEK